MSDNIEVSSGFFSAKLAAKEIEAGSSGASDPVHYQRILPVALDALGTPGDVSLDAPFPVKEIPQSETPFMRFLDSVGDGSGVKNAIGDYSGAATAFSITPASGTTLWIAGLTVEITDVGTLGPETYGAIAVLPNGITLRVRRNGTTVATLTDNVSIKKNFDWYRYAARVDTWSSASLSGLRAVIDLRDTGRMIRLRGAQSESLEVLLNDDLRGLVTHYFIAKGYTV